MSIIPARGGSASGTINLLILVNPPMSLIKVQNLSKDYINEDVVTPVLHGLTFNIEVGEFVAIMGPSGSGK